MPPPEAGIDHVIYTDASDEGYGVIQQSTLGDQVYADTWTPTMAVKTIAEREMYAAKCAIVDAMAASQSQDVPIRIITLFTDNTNCISWLTKRRAKNYFVNSLLRDVLSALGKVPLDVRYVKSADNPADRPSRLPREYDSVRPPYCKASSPSDSKVDPKATTGGPSTPVSCTE